MTIPPRRSHWVALLLLAAAALAIVMVPVFLIRPFAPQTPGSIALSYALRRWSPWLTPLAAIAAVLIMLRIWRGAPRFLARSGAVGLALLALAAAWMSRQNHFEWMFAPLPDARFVRAMDASAVEPGDMVLAVEARGDAVAYPVRQLAYHHLVEDEVGRVPIVATY